MGGWGLGKRQTTQQEGVVDDVGQPCSGQDDKRGGLGYHDGSSNGYSCGSGSAMVNNVWAMSGLMQSWREEIVHLIVPQIVSKPLQKIAFFEEV